MDSVTDRSIIQQLPQHERLLQSADWGGQLMRLIIIPCLLLLCSVSIMPFDMLIVRQMKTDPGPKFFREVIENTEPFGHAIGVVFICWAVFTLAPQVRPYLPRTICSAIGAGLATNLFKLIIGRTRPRDLADVSVGLAETFTGWMPILNGTKLSQSFPSAHSTVAVAFAVALSSLFPQGRVMFFVLAGCVCFDRIQCLAHYPSDVFAGAACGWLFAQLTIDGPLANRLFSTYELKRQSTLKLPGHDAGQSQQQAA